LVTGSRRARGMRMLSLVALGPVSSDRPQRFLCSELRT
jgi:hypothetical protein